MLLKLFLTLFNICISHHHKVKPTFLTIFSPNPFSDCSALHKAIIKPLTVKSSFHPACSAQPMKLIDISSATWLANQNDGHIQVMVEWFQYEVTEKVYVSVYAMLNLYGKHVNTCQGVFLLQEIGHLLVVYDILPTFNRHQPCPNGNRLQKNQQIFFLFHVLSSFWIIWIRHYHHWYERLHLYNQ